MKAAVAKKKYSCLVLFSVSSVTNTRLRAARSWRERTRRVVFPVEVPPAMSEGEATNDDVFASLDQIFVDNAEIDAAFPSSESPERHAEQGTLYATAAPVRTTAAGLPHPLAAATAAAASGAAAFASAMMMDDLSSPAAAEDALESSAPVSAVASPTLAWSGGHVPWSTAAADDGALRDLLL